MRHSATVRLFVAVLLVTPSIVSAQRLSQLEPGTLVRIRTASGQRIVGPLAEVRADSVFLSTTAKSADTALALTSVQSFEYADGTETGNGALGLLVGAAVGGTLGMLGGRESGNDGCHTCGTFVVALTALGAIIGFAAGSSTSEPVWVLPTRSQTSRAATFAASPVLQWRIRF